MTTDPAIEAAAEAMDRVGRAEDSLARIVEVAHRLRFEYPGDADIADQLDVALTGQGWHQCHGCSKWGDENGSLHNVTGPWLTDGDWFCDDCVSTP